MMRRLLTIGLLALVLTAVIAVPIANADPGPNNKQVQYRTIDCDNGHSYDVGFVSPVSATFFLVGSTNTFAIKEFTVDPFGEFGEPQTFNYGINGFDPSSLLHCSYTDPEGVFNVFSGFITPR
jgi:hypothetical protein